MKVKSVLLGALLITSLLITGCSQSAAKANTSAAAAAEETVQSADAKSGATESTAVLSDAAGIIKDITTIQAFTDEAVAQEDIDAIVAAGVNAPSAMNGQPWHFTVITDSEVLEKIASDMGGGFSGFRPAEASAEGGAGAPDGMTPPEGMTFPEGASAPEGMTRPEGASAPEGMTRPEGASAPEGMTPPEGASAPEGMGTPPAANTSSGAKAGIADAPLVIIVSCKTGSELDAGLAAQNMSAEAQLLGYGTKIVSSPKMAINGSNRTEYQQLLGIPEDMSAVCMLLVGKTNTADYDAVSGATARNAVQDIVTYLP